MDRLTNRSEEMPTPISDNAQYYAFCVNRLADYEDTGLTPDEIRDVPIHRYPAGRSDVRQSST